MVFTSSAEVYRVKNGRCTETSSVHRPGEITRAEPILAAEAAISPGGNIVRMTELYNSSRGSHVAFLRQKSLRRWKDSILNLIHYEDAARLVMAVWSRHMKPLARRHMHAAYVHLGGTVLLCKLYGHKAAVRNQCCAQSSRVVYTCSVSGTVRQESLLCRCF